MTKKIIIILLFLSTTFYAQNKKKSRIDFINMTSLSSVKNTESYFTRYSTDKDRSSKGFSFDFNTIYGIRFYNRVAISAGISLNYNIDQTFFSTPYIVDLRVFTNENGGNRFFAYLQTGKNIKWSESFNGDGFSAKMGVGIIVEYNQHLSYYVDILKKSNEIEIEKSKDKGWYKTTGFGISLGLIF